MMKHVLLFLNTNLAIILVFGAMLSLLGIERILVEQGVGLDLYNLLILTGSLALREKD